MVLVLLPVFYTCAGRVGENGSAPAGGAIDREALVRRHTVHLRDLDTLGSLTVGNGNFAFTADISGLQSFPQAYENGISLGTQTNWGWHTFPEAEEYTLEDVAVAYPTVGGRRIPYAVQHREGHAARATHGLRSNPHRLHLGLIGLQFTKSNGDTVDISDLQEVDQQLDLWTGELRTTYRIEGQPVRVSLYAHDEADQIAFRVNSPLIRQGRLRLQLRFPYGADCHVCPGYDFSHPERHRTEQIADQVNGALLQRQLDSTRYYVALRWAGGGRLREAAAQRWEWVPDSEQDAFNFAVQFAPEALAGAPADYDATRTASERGWATFWRSGGAIDFSECTDPRAFELERRVVLSLYLTRAQCAGDLPPQETGLTMNSWYGKFHLEMHWWHGVHFALWNRLPLLERSLDWYREIMPRARATAAWQGFAGVRWPKMTNPQGQESPSSVGAFLIWQQPHPIYFAELVYRQRPTPATLAAYGDIVAQTAEFMASFTQHSAADGYYHLYHPLIPAQELFAFDQTDDPPFELAYWRYGLEVAQRWRERQGLALRSDWQTIIDGLLPLPVRDSLYLPSASAPLAYEDDHFRRDHPMVTGMFGLLPAYPGLDTSIMRRTYREIVRHWQWDTTWGWDYPMLATCAARLGDGEAAVDALLMPVQKNTYLVNGHNYQDERLRLYLPGNGGLLMAVAMMAAGWDGAPDRPNPGFPNNGQWKVRWEQLSPMP